MYMNNKQQIHVLYDLNRVHVKIFTCTDGLIYAMWG